MGKEKKIYSNDSSHLLFFFEYCQPLGAGAFTTNVARSAELLAGL